MTFKDPHALETAVLLTVSSTSTLPSEVFFTVFNAFNYKFNLVLSFILLLEVDFGRKSVNCQFGCFVDVHLL